MTRAWKFLDERSRGTFSGFEWPTAGADGTPGPWVHQADVAVCERGVHACRSDDLAWWMSAQLWEIELDGPVIADERKVVAPKGRLVRLVGDWPSVGAPLSEWAVWRVRGHVADALGAAGDSSLSTRLGTADNLHDAVAAVTDSPHTATGAAGIAVAQLVDACGDLGNPILACHDAARAAGHAATIGDPSILNYQGAFAAERLAQSRWIAERLGLSD